MEASQQASEGAPVLQAMDENYKEALESQKKAQREARLAAERAANEYSNRRKCLDLERQARQSQTTEPALVTTAKQTPRKFQLPVFGSGMYVEVEPDMSPGKCSNGGNAHVQAVVYKDGEPLFTVEYDENSNNGRVERDVPLWRLKEKSYGSYFRPGPRPERECTKRAPLASLDPQSTRKPPPPERDLIDELKHGWTQNRKRGWRASDLGVAPRNRHCDRSTEFKRLFLMDLQFLRGYHKVEPVPYHSLRCKETGHFKAAKKEGQPISVKYLCKAWGVGKNAPADFEQQSRDGTLERKKRSYDTLIDGGSNAEAHFDPKVLYINVHVSDMREAYWASSPTGPISLETIEGWKADANVEWTLRLSDSEKAVWEFMSRTRLEKLQHLKGDLLEALNSNVTKSYRALASDAEGLVSWTTIYRFMKSQGVCLYTQRPLPLLSDLQKERHVAYCVHRLNNWGLPPQKTLLINFDEKWWDNTPKVMGVGVVAFAYDGNVENGGEGVKIGMYRAEKAKIALKTQNESRRDAQGKLHYDGPVVRRKGEAYMVDCNVTGSNTGTASDPKFALKDLFELTIFPAIDELVREGGRYAGYLPVFQGDNAGPHIDATFLSFVKELCESRRWLWEPQAPQMPHMNVLDLAIFAAMARAHTTLLGNYSNTAAPAKEIWRTCLEVFRSFESAAIARAFVLAHRIAKKVVANNGDNAFLRTGGLHCDVHKDFRDTATGIERIN